MHISGWCVDSRPKDKGKKEHGTAGCHGQGKTTVNFVVFFQVREKSRNFVFVKNLDSEGKTWE